MYKKTRIWFLMVLIMLFMVACESGEDIANLDSNVETDTKSISNTEEVLDFDNNNLTITNTVLMIDEGGYRNWPFDGYPEIIDLDIDYSKVIKEFKEVLRSAEGVQICNMGQYGCVLYGPTPAFRIYFNDGVKFLSLSIDVEDIEKGQRITVVRVMEGNETRLTIPGNDLQDNYNAIFNIIDEAYSDYVESID